MGYKSYLISTIVDMTRSPPSISGYKSYLISTIVDAHDSGRYVAGAISLI